MLNQQSWQVGHCKVTRIEELMGPLFDARSFFPDYDLEIMKQHEQWISPWHFDFQTERMIASMHSWLIETPHHKILIDTCIGNDKDRMPYKDWHQMQSPWLDRLAATGIRPDDIDFVMCTHLHVDHVGWNTQRIDGKWIPTFPNATYVFSQIEFDFWQEQRNENEGEAFSSVNNKTFDDSVLPIVHLAQMVEGTTELIDDLLRIDPAPGHTPGSITIGLTSASQEALFTGDILHHPIQVVEPHWNSAFCELPDQARATRLKVLSYCAEHDCLMMPAHFGPSHAGKVRRLKDNFHFDFSNST